MEVDEEELLGKSTACKAAFSPTIVSITNKEQQILATKILCKELLEGNLPTAINIVIQEVTDMVCKNTIG